MKQIAFLWWAVITIQGTQLTGIFWDAKLPPRDDRTTCELDLPSVWGKMARTPAVQEVLDQAEAGGQHLVFTQKCVDTPPDSVDVEPLHDSEGERS